MKLSRVYEEDGNINMALVHLKKSHQLNYNPLNNDKIYELMLKKGVTMLEKN